MKSILLFVRTTLTGGIIFLLPVVLLTIILAKAYNILIKASAPISERLPDLILGLDGSRLLVIFLLIIICFFSGLLFRSIRVKKWVEKLEDNVLIYMPGYALTKAITADAVGGQVDHNMTPILVGDGENWNLGFLVEEGETRSTVFIPDAPRYDAGEIRIVPSQFVQKLDISVHKFTQSIKVFGKGALHWVK
jgi:uncharacterized membrane protein